MNRITKKLLLSFVVLAIASCAAFAQTGQVKPTLHVVVIGVSKYQNDRPETGKSLSNGVHFAAKDAQDMANQFAAQEGKLYSKVNVVRLINESATRQNIMQALSNLQYQVKPNDYVVVFAAGHGDLDPLGQYFYVPHDYRPGETSSAVPWSVFRQGLARLPGIRFLILDTCRSAGATGPGASSVLLPADGSVQGLITLAACLTREVSDETGSLQNGIFTHAVVEALQGKADFNKDGVVTLSELYAYVCNRVQELNPSQRPTMENFTSIPGNLQLAFVMGGQSVPGVNQPVVNQPVVFPTGSQPINVMVSNNMPIRPENLR